MKPSSSTAQSPLGDVSHGNKPIDHQIEGSPEVGRSATSNGRTRAGTISSSPLVSSMSLNDNKAGMEGLDTDRINKIIHEASKGSKFYENEKRKEAVLNLKIQQQQSLAASITDSQLQFGLHQVDQLLSDLEERRDLSHTIVHVDMDAFYAAVEMRDDPSLREKPMAVGSMSMLSTSNYVARRFGIRAAMPGFIARKLCPELAIVPLNFDKYIAVSETVKEILAVYDPNFSPMSLDEAYLDFTEHLRERIHSPLTSRTFLLRTKGANACSTACMCDLNLVLRPLLLLEVDLSQDQIQAVENVVDVNQLFSHCLETEHFKTCSVCRKPFSPFTLKVYGIGAEDAVLEMRNRIEQRTHLTASAGIAPNTMLAKICSDKNKPNGQFHIEPIKEHVQQFISALSVRKIPGIGKVTEKLLEALGVLTCQDLHRQRALLYHMFSPTSFHHFMSIALGISSSVLERDGERKSISTEHTFGELAQPTDLMNKCQELCQFLSRDLKKERFVGKTVTLKIKTVGFEVKTRAHTLSHYSNDEKTIFTAAKHLLDTEIENVQPECLRLRLMGVRMSKLVSETNNPSSVASFFGKQGRNNSTWKQSAVGCSPAEETKLDTGERSDVTAASSLCSSGQFKDFPQQDCDDDDDDTDFQECIDNNKLQETTQLNKPTPGTKTMNKCTTQRNTGKNKMGKQETMVHFLCSKQNCCILGDSNCECGHCVVWRKSCASAALGTINSDRAASAGTDNGSETFIVVDNVNRTSVDTALVNRTCGDNGYVNIAFVDKQTVNKTSVSGVSVLDANLRCSDFSMRSHTSSVSSTGQHHQLCTSVSSTAGQHHQLCTSVSNTGQHHQLCTSVSSTGQHHQLCTSVSSTGQHHQLCTSVSSTGQHHQVSTLSPVTCGEEKPISLISESAAHSSGMIHCPVCGQQKYQWPLGQLNAHIDLCLSRSTVREILTDQQDDQQGPMPRKRSKSTQVTDSRSDKRTKTQHTLLSFFKP